MKRVVVAVLALVVQAAPALAANEPEGFSIEVIVENAAQPTALDFLPDGRIVYAERTGEIRIIDPQSGQSGGLLVGTIPGSVVADLPASELGLTGLARDPEFEENGYLYVWHSVDIYGTQRLSRVTVADDAFVGGSLVALWETPETHDTVNEHHVGGGIAFGPDGYLYFSIGDRWSWTDSQRVTRSSGAVHRIARDGSIPVDNPFYDGPGPNVDSIFTMGHRNPFRIRWDLPSASLYVAEVGWDSFEEINVIRPNDAGGNYEWNICEGDIVRGDPASACARSFVPAFLQRSGGVLQRPIVWAAGVFALLVAGGLLALSRSGRLSRRWLVALGLLLAVAPGWVVLTKSFNLQERLSSFRAPAFTYQHDVASNQPTVPDTSLGASVTGGVVYRGDAFPPAYDGAYFFGDFMNGWVGYLTFDDPEEPRFHPFSDAIGGVTDVHMSPDGDLYYVRLFDTAGDPARSGSILRVSFDGT
ncbi:MAG: PQQ-dependent sugar dehydrogenase [Acidimicrobiia bacterium]|nr:PQQ-dependent sugar dehydrogenase [Acidimicrobiia bacterium]NNF09829.1 hypothetical protein [Acidimicrobiia bacterium]NNL71259.1 hypothetical protein [Acidimicrobiia bacterium]